MNLLWQDILIQSLNVWGVIQDMCVCRRRKWTSPSSTEYAPIEEPSFHQPSVYRCAYTACPFRLSNTLSTFTVMCYPFLCDTHTHWHTQPQLCACARRMVRARSTFSPSLDLLGCVVRAGTCGRLVSIQSAAQRILRHSRRSTAVLCHQSTRQKPFHVNLTGQT